MKFITLILLSFLTASCSDVTNSDDVVSNENKAKQVVVESATSTSSFKKNVDKEKVRKAIILAKQNNDYRLLATSGRSTTVPGVDVSRFQTLLELCGKKYSSAVGDVITSPEQRLARKEHVDFMRQYNEQMLVLCRKSQEK